MENNEIFMEKSKTMKVKINKKYTILYNVLFK